MANNYSVSSLTFFPKDVNSPLKFSAAARSLIRTQVCHEYTEDEAEVVTDTGSGSGTDCLNQILANLAEDAQVELQETETVGGLFKKLIGIKYINSEVGEKLSEWMGKDTFIEDCWDSVNLPDMLKFFIHDPECNYGGCYEETGWYCDKNRHGEFGGGVAITSEHFNFSSYPAMYSDIMYKMVAFPGDATVLANIVKSNLRTILHGIKDPSLRSTVTKLVIDDLLNSEKQDVPSTGE